MADMIPAEFQQFINQEIAAGKYPTADAVLLAGLRLLQRREQELEELRREIQIGFDELDRGEGIELSEAGLKEFFEDVKTEGRRRLSNTEQERGQVSDRGNSSDRP